MAEIDSTDKFFQHELGDIYDAEHQFLNAMQEMLQNAQDATLKQMLTTHIQQTKGQITNLEQVFQLLGQPAQRVMCDGAKGLVSEGQKGMKDTSGGIEDVAIAGAADRVEHYEIAAYRGLIEGAQLMGQQQVVSLLQQNLNQEEETSALIEKNTPMLMQTAMRAEGKGMSQPPTTPASFK